MKKKIKKIFIVFLAIILMFIFNININVSAQVINIPFTNTYRHSDVQLYSLDASLYAFNNFYVSSYATNKHLRLFLISSDLYSGQRIYRQYLIGYNEENCEIKLHDGYVYIYIKGLGNSYKTYYQNVQTGSMTDSGGVTGSYSSDAKAVLKLSKDNIKYRISFSDSSINSVDDYIVKDITNSFSYNPSDLKFSNVEYNSIGSLTGETYQNNADIGNPRYYGITLIDKQKFIDWIITNQKYTVFSDYGLSNLSSTVDDIINLWEEYNSSPLKFFSSIPSFLISNGSIFSSYEKAKELFNLLDSLYQEFKISQQQKIFEVGTNGNLLPHQRINPNITDSIYIEDVSDPTYIKILREILKTLIQLPNDIYTLFDYYLFNLSSNTSLIADYISQLPEYLSTLQYNKFAPLFDNIGGGDSIENITNYNIQNLYTLNDIDNPLLNLEANINNKFPIINQTNNLVDFDNYIVDTPIAPVFTMKKPTLSSDLKITGTEEEIIFADFSKLSTFSVIVKSIISVFFVFYFIKWVQNYIPKLMAGYNETD